MIHATVLDQVHLDSLTDWIVHLTLLQAYSEHQFARELGVAWSLSVEVAFYAFVPLYFVVLRSLGARAAPFRALWVGTAALFFGGFAFVVWTGSWRQLNVIAWLPFEMPVFAIGIALAILHELRSRGRGPRGTFDLVARIAGWWWLLAAAILALAAVLWGETVLFRVAHRVGTQVLYTGFGLCMALPVVFPSTRTSRLDRVLNHRVVAYVGLVSYGVYLWHLQIIDLIQHTWFPGGFVSTNTFRPVRRHRGARGRRRDRELVRARTARALVRAPQTRRWLDSDDGNRARARRRTDTRTASARRRRRLRSAPSTSRPARRRRRPCSAPTDHLERQPDRLTPAHLESAAGGEQLEALRVKNRTWPTSRMPRRS